MDQRLAPALRKLNSLLTEAAVNAKVSLRFALIGGLATSTWGIIRATEDIDFLADSEPSPHQELGARARLTNFIEQQGGHADWRVGDYDDPIPLLLRIQLPANYEGIGADILWVHRRWQRDALQRAVGVKLAGDEIPVLRPEDLILLKLEAGGPQDLLDVQSLLTSSSRSIDTRYLKAVAARLRLQTLLNTCLKQASRSRQSRPRQKKISPRRD